MTNETLNNLNVILDSLSADELSQVSEHIKRKLDNDGSNIVFYVQFYIQQGYNTITGQFEPGAGILGYDDIVPDGPTHKLTFDCLTRKFVSIEPIDTGVNR